jgi:hypothetical protein
MTRALFIAGPRELRKIEEAGGFEGRDGGVSMLTEDEAEQARIAIKQVHAATRRGDRLAADHWLKIAERIAAAYAARPQLPKENEEVLRAELRARVARFCDMSNEITRWEWERDVHAEYSARAAREGLPAPPPLRPCPYNDSALERVARGEVVPELVQVRREGPSS